MFKMREMMAGNGELSISKLLYWCVCASIGRGSCGVAELSTIGYRGHDYCFV